MNLQRFVKQSALNLFQQGSITCVYHGHILEDFEPGMFAAAYWQKKQAVLGSATGRGTTYFVEHQGGQFVLRHYYRGGMVGKFINDRYFYTGMMNTRAVKEFQLLMHLRELKLPAPEPIGFAVHRHGLTYSADILTGLIHNARDLVGCLQEKPLTAEQWQNIGATIYEFHRYGIFHHDLNCHNIMLDNAGKVWLIDFDQGKVEAPLGSWCQQNLDRLLRSFRKELDRLHGFQWQESDWQALMSGYQRLETER
ncbi:3-deoxy-D-manno-octulosonic acid kinase [Thalassotalea mangrovi]|uniref:3-deoxy-D-manno-octulosonic acid kinase n=1 Tax=Thalassotalea mangrovi TaxID=2572245 RepID=UPI001FE95948|nr:3-deoxy-D-manno-octulosonic acid kinase [Thalassotalea mangrovi]